MSSTVINSNIDVLQKFDELICNYSIFFHSKNMNIDQTIANNHDNCNEMNQEALHVQLLTNNHQIYYQRYGIIINNKF